MHSGGLREILLKLMGGGMVPSKETHTPSVQTYLVGSIVTLFWFCVVFGFFDELIY